jgi:hypothetical protein
MGGVGPEASIRMYPNDRRGEMANVVVADAKAKHQVHEPDCFIVTTHAPGLDWRPTSKPVTCGFCVKRMAKRKRDS